MAACVLSNLDGVRVFRSVARGTNINAWKRVFVKICSRLDKGSHLFSNDCLSGFLLRGSSLRDATRYITRLRCTKRQIMLFDDLDESLPPLDTSYRQDVGNLGG